MFNIPYPVYAKSAFDIKQLFTKQDIGCDGIEYQMQLSDFTGYSNEPLNNEGMIKDLLETVPASAIHIPTATSNLEDIANNSHTKTQLEQAFKLASYSRRFGSDDIKIIVHTEVIPSQVGSTAMYAIESFLDSIFNRYADVSLVIENTTPFRHLQENKSQLSSGYFDAPIQWIDRLGYSREKRVGACLDICHAMVSKIYMEAVYSIFGKDVSDLSLESFFETYAPHLKLIHLANFSGNGYGQGNHETPFEKDKPQDMELLEHFASLYKKYVPNNDVDVTLEINESDLLTSRGYASTLQALISVYD